MKHILLLCFLLAASICSAQKQSPEIRPLEIGYPTANLDTLYLADTEEGWLIYKVWKDNPKPKPPVIIFTDIMTIQELYRTRTIVGKDYSIPEN